MAELESNLVPASPMRNSAVHSLTSLLERDDRLAWAGPSKGGLREWVSISLS
jgi:hypothetical protein